MQPKLLARVPRAFLDQTREILRLNEQAAEQCSGISLRSALLYNFVEGHMAGVHACG
jgi:hypothetical protein